MTTRDDGGPAFPAAEFELNTGVSGMSLRDWFAGQALNGFLRNQGAWPDIAKDAYALADAMLAERSKPHDPRHV